MELTDPPVALADPGAGAANPPDAGPIGTSAADDPGFSRYDDVDFPGVGPTPPAAAAPDPSMPQGSRYNDVEPTNAPGGPGIMSRVLNWAGSQFTGSGRTEFPDLPEMTASNLGLGVGDAKSWKLLAAIATSGMDMEQMAGDPKASDPADRTGILQNILPGAQISYDKFSNPIITYNGKSAYVNKPGWSPNDAAANLGGAAIAYGASRLGGKGADLFKMGPAELPPGAVTAPGQGLINMAGRSAIQGISQAGASAAQDALAGAQGSNQGVNFTKGALQGTLGAVAEPLVSLGAAGLGAAGRGLSNLAGGAEDAVDAIGSYLGAPGRAAADYWRTTFGMRGNLLTDAAASADPTTTLTPDMLTKTGQLVLSKTGYGPSDFSVGQMQRMQSIVGNAGREVFNEAPPPGNVGTAQRVAQSVRTGVPLTTGQATGNLAQLSLEDSLKKTGATAGEFAPFRTQQLTGINDQAANLVPSPLPGITRSEPEIGADIGSAIANKDTAMKAETTNAYPPDMTGLAMATGQRPGMWFDPKVSSDILDGIRQTHMQTALLPTWDKANQARQLVAEALTGPEGGAAPGAQGVAAMSAVNPPDTSTIARATSLGSMLELQQSLRGLIGQSKNPAEIRFIQQMLNNVNDGTNGAVMKQLTYGDPNIAEELSAGQLAAFKNFQFLGQDTPAVHDFMTSAANGDLSAQQIVNAIYGSSKLGAGMNTPQIVAHLKTQFGADSPEFNLLREAAARRMIYGAKPDAAGAATDNLVPGYVAGRIRDAVEGSGQETTNALFSPDEIGNMTELRKSIQSTLAGNPQNTSGTAYTGANMFNQWLQRVPVIGKQIANWGNEKALAQARQAVGGQLAPSMWADADTPFGVLAKRRVAPVAGGLLGQDAEQTQRQ
jgi:hypothetical protein